MSNGPDNCLCKPYYMLILDLADRPVHLFLEKYNGGFLLATGPLDFAQRSLQSSIDADPLGIYDWRSHIVADQEL